MFDHRALREDLARQGLARAIAAVAARQERAVAADERVASCLAWVRDATRGSVALDELRSGWDALALARTQVCLERAMVVALEAVCERRRADLVRASQNHGALPQRGRSLERRHGAQPSLVEGIALDELAMRRATRIQEEPAA